MFTRGDEGGNHLGVVSDLMSLETGSMQAIAANLGFSETVFIDATGEVPHCRIFTPTSELPFAGHPLVGSAWYLHSVLSRRSTQVTCAVGSIDISSSGESASIVAPSHHESNTIASSGLDGLGLPESAVAFSVLMPIPYTVAQLASPEAVSAYRPTESQLGQHRLGQMLTVWADSAPGVIRMRFFAPGHGIFEDPATGSAAVAVAAVQRASGAMEGSVLIHQGSEVGMPSAIRLDWDAQRTKVGGDVRHDETREI